MMRRPSAKWLLLLPPILLALAYSDREAHRAPGDWRSASREPVGLAPDPATTPEAVVQVYAARAVRWRGLFGVHTWLATKPAGADRFTVYEVTGWRLRRNGTSVTVGERRPDSRWYGNAPDLVAERRGPEAEPLIERIAAAVQRYPYADRYRVWPGPNSNTFTAFILREVPELRADLPPTAIGKDYLGSSIAATSPSGTGVQVSVLGLVGVLAGIEEGLEVNLLGLTFGIDPKQLALKLPLAGQLGLRDVVQTAEAQTSDARTSDAGAAD
jgi:Protein of unknown function (DUF3750)